jgi:delta24-sterol reductase
MIYRHDRIVKDITIQVARFYEQKKPFKIYHGSSNSTRVLTFKRGEIIDTSKLGRVLSVNAKTLKATVEPCVAMDKLVRSTLKYNMIPAVVMEFPGITVGGGVQGGAGESSSFKYGCFSKICDWHEIILANGKLEKISPSRMSDLYFGTAGAYGTLGIIVKSQVKLVRAKPYIKLEYIPVNSFKSAISLINKSVKQNYDFVDGIMFGLDEGVIMLGKFSSYKKGGKRQKFSRPFDPWFYLHAQNKARLNYATEEYIPVKGYLFRYNRGAFWMGKHAFDLFGVRFNKLTRFILDPILRTRKLYQALHVSNASQNYLIQDLALPQSKAVEFLQDVHKRLNVYPLWLCPLKPDDKSPMQSNNIKTKLVINIGIWSGMLSNRKKFIEANRFIEELLIKLGGKKWFYAHAYYTQDEFWHIYDKKWYEELRKKYSAESLPNIYDKVVVKQVYKVNNKKGLIRTLLGLTKIPIK